MDNTTARIECSGCDRFFSSNTTFVAHRTGDISKGERRCMTDDEMTAHGFATEQKNVKIVLDGRATYQGHDVWYDAIGREDVRNRFKDKEDTPSE